MSSRCWGWVLLCPHLLVRHHDVSSFRAASAPADPNAAKASLSTSVINGKGTITYNGKEVWTYDLGAYTHGQGGATSPIVVDDLVKAVLHS